MTLETIHAILWTKFEGHRKLEFARELKAMLTTLT
jgi:hypothetical protein